MSSVLYIQFPEGFEKRYTKYKAKVLDSSTSVATPPKSIALPTPKSKILSAQLKHGLLTLNESTGLVEFNEVKNNINPQGQEFRTILKLITNGDYLATYTDLLGENYSKDAKRNLGFTIRNIKETLGILPKSKQKTKTVFKTLKGTDIN